MLRLSPCIQPVAQALAFALLVSAALSHAPGPPTLSSRVYAMQNQMEFPQSLSALGPEYLSVSPARNMYSHQSISAAKTLRRDALPITC